MIKTSARPARRRAWKLERKLADYASSGFLRSEADRVQFLSGQVNLRRRRHA